MVGMQWCSGGDVGCSGGDVGALPLLSHWLQCSLPSSSLLLLVLVP